MLITYGEDRTFNEDDFGRATGALINSELLIDVSGFRHDAPFSSRSNGQFEGMKTIAMCIPKNQPTEIVESSKPNHLGLHNPAGHISPFPTAHGGT